MTNFSNKSSSGVEQNTLDPEKIPTETQSNIQVNPVPDVPSNNLWIVVPAILLLILIPALDQTITAVALPTIIGELGGENAYSWVGAAYLLASASCSTVYGKLSDIIGRKPVYFIAMFFFILGSALGGAAQSFLWLAIARGIQGAGGGGLIQLSMITISDITPLEKRGFYVGLVGTIWGVASVAGPTVGGALTDHASWRWCFWINLPAGGVLSLVLLFLLKLKPAPRRPFGQVIRQFDFIGLFLVISGVACFLVGLEVGQDHWSSAAGISLICIGVVLIVGFCLHELFTKRVPILPPRLFRTRTPTAVLLCAFIHGMAVFSGSYYIPLYFQVLGSSATIAGVKTMAFSLTSSVSGALAGIISVKIGYRPVLWVSWALIAIGFGLMIQLDNSTSIALQVIYIFIAGAGVGGIFQIPLIALHASMPISDMAMSTSAFMLLRLLGSAVGVSVGEAIFTTEVKKRLSTIANYSIGDSNGLTNNLTGLHNIQPISTRNEVLYAYSRSLSVIWEVLTPVVLAGFLFSLSVRKYSLKKKTTEEVVSDKTPRDEAIVEEEVPV